MEGWMDGWTEGWIDGGRDGGREELREGTWVWRCMPRRSRSRCPTCLPRNHEALSNRLLRVDVRLP